MASVTILSTINPAHPDAQRTILTKSFAPLGDGWSKSKIAMPVAFRCEERSGIDSIHDLSSLLLDLEGDPYSCIIRGQPKADINRASARRTIHDKPGLPSCFIDAPCPFVCIDIDEVTGGLHLSPTQRLARAISGLPAPFQGISFHYQWSSSMGLFDPDLIKLHLWFWLDQPVTSAVLKARAKAENWPSLIDLSVFQPVQPHFTAAPIFLDAADPIKKRSGLIRQARDSVTLHDWTPPAPRPVVAPRPTRTAFQTALLAADPSLAGRRKAYFAAVLHNAGGEIVNPPCGSRHTALFLAAARVDQAARGCAIDPAEEQSAYDELVHYARMAGLTDSYDITRHIKNGRAAGRGNPPIGPII